ncbi:MAG TPA: hypothetical protein VGG69_08510 [Rhizomicrobium sp.]
MSGTAQIPAAEGSDARLFALICYGLFMAALATGFTGIVGVVLAYIKRVDTRGTIWESHFTGLIRLFWTGVAVFALWLTLVIGGVIGVASGIDHDTIQPLAALLPAAWLLSLVYLVWYVYRTAHGLLRAIDGQPYS